MSDDNFSTRKVSASEMDQLKVLLDKVESLRDVRIDVTADVYARVEAVMSLCAVDSGSEETRFIAAVNEIFLAGLAGYEARLDSNE